MTYPNRGIATMIDPPEESGSRTILVPKVRTDKDFVFLLLTPKDAAGDGPIAELSLRAGRDSRPTTAFADGGEARPRPEAGDRQSAGNSRAGPP